MAKDWIKFFELAGDPFNTIPLQSVTDFHELLIKTDDINKHIDPLLTHFEESKPFLRVIVGPRGSGKSTILHYAISVVRHKKGVVACYVSHQPSIIEGSKDPVFGIGNDTALRLLIELSKALLISEGGGEDAELVDFAKEVGLNREGRFLEDGPSFPEWSYSRVSQKLTKLLEFIQKKGIRALVAIDNYDKHNEDIAIAFLASHFAQPIFEELQSVGVSLFLTADVEWSKNVAKNSDLNYLGEPISLSEINPIEARSLIKKRIAAKLLTHGVQEIFEDDAISSIAIKEDGIARNIMETCRICLIEAAARSQKCITRALADEILRTRETRAQKYYECIKRKPKAIEALNRIVGLWKEVDPDTFRKMLHGLVNFWQGESVDDEILSLLREKRLIYRVIPQNISDMPTQTKMPPELAKMSKAQDLQVLSDVRALLESVGKKYSLNAFVDWLAKGEPSIFFVPTAMEQDTFNQMKSQFQQLLALFSGNVRLLLRNAQTAYNSWCSQIEGGDYDVTQVLSDMWTCLWSLSLCAYFAVKVLIEEKQIKKNPEPSVLETFLLEQEMMRPFLPSYSTVETYYRYSEKGVPIDPAMIERLHLESQSVISALMDLCKSALPFLAKFGMEFPAFKAKNAEELYHQLYPYLRGEDQYSYIFLEEVIPEDFMLLCWIWRNFIYAFFFGKDELKRSHSLDVYDFQKFKPVTSEQIQQQMGVNKLSSSHLLRFYNVLEFCSYLMTLSRKRKVQLRIFSKTQTVFVTLFTKENETVASMNYSKPQYGSKLDLESIGPTRAMKDNFEQHGLIRPDDPFRNRIQYQRMISDCDEFLYWVDKYFSKVGLEYLLDSTDPLRIKEIKILTSVSSVDEKFRKLFKEFMESMKRRGITVELRCMDPKLEEDIHDRWVFSKHKNFNMPSPDVVARGQFSEIKETANKPPFYEWWTKSKDIIKEWDNIRRSK